MSRKVFLILVQLTYVLICFAQPSINAVFTENPPNINGVLESGEWVGSEPLTEIFQRQPNEGHPMTEKTEVYILYDKNNLYFGVRCLGNPADITAKELARDVSLGEDDRIQIILDTYLDRRTGYWFQIGPRGSIGDALISENGAAFNKAWDGLWDGKAKITANGWEAEVIIPFKTLSFKKGQTEWGFKFIRHIKKKAESGYWPVANLDSYKFQVSDAGFLTGLEGISKGVGLDISPYAIARRLHKNGNKTKYEADAGFDLFYRVTPGLKAALTVNTDFAQTEVDSRQINLTRFGLHFPEKRDFFLDGANYFQFGIEGDDNSNYNKRIIPFFSRTLGLDNNGNPIPILYGGKLTGQMGKFNVGFINITDDRDSTKKNFTTTRISYNLGKESSIGVIGTYGNSMSEMENGLFGMDAKLASSTFMGDKNVALILFGLKSKTDEISGKDHAWGAELSYPNDFLSLRLGHNQIGENFVAGMGFVPRTGIKESYFETGLGPRPNKYGILQINMESGIDYITNFSNQLETRKFFFSPLAVDFLSGEAISYTITSQYEQIFDDFNIYDEYVIPEDNYNFVWQLIHLESAKRRNFFLETDLRFGDFYNGKRNDIIVNSGYKIIVPLFIGMEVEHNDVKLPEGSFTADVYRANANLLFSPNMTLYNFIQYDNRSETMGWQSRFRWIIKPGKEILLVWNSLANDPFERFAMENNNLQFKAKYNIRF